MIKKILYNSLLILICLLIKSCTKDENLNDYYVKYKIITESKYNFTNIEVKLLTENGTEIKTVPKNWEKTFGPFKEGTIVKMNVKYTGKDKDHVSNNTKFFGRIYVRKNNMPFVLKASSQSIGSLNMGCIIED